MMWGSLPPQSVSVRGPCSDSTGTVLRRPGKAGPGRERILARLLDRHAISKELVQKLLAWRHPGFSAHVGEPICAQDRQRLEDTAAYLVRNPLSLKKLVCLDGQQAVL